MLADKRFQTDQERNQSFKAAQLSSTKAANSHPWLIARTTYLTNSNLAWSCT